MLDGYASKTGHRCLGRLRTLVFSGCCITKKVHCDYQPSLPFAVVTNRSISLEGNKWWSGAITDRVKYVVCVKSRYGSNDTQNEDKYFEVNNTFWQRNLFAWTMKKNVVLIARYVRTSRRWYKQTRRRRSLSLKRSFRCCGQANPDPGVTTINGSTDRRSSTASRLLL
jgi:hypothetical protein